MQVARILLLVHSNAKLLIQIFFRFIQERMGEPRFYSMDVLNNVATMEDLLERRYLLHFSSLKHISYCFCLFVCMTHRRRKVLNIRGGGARIQNIGRGGVRGS